MTESKEDSGPKLAKSEDEIVEMFAFMPMIQEFIEKLCNLIIILLIVDCYQY